MRRTGLIRHSYLLGAAIMAASSAAAQDAPEGGFSLSFGIDQRFDLGRNVDLETPAEGTSATSATRFSFGLSSITPLDRLEFNASAGLFIEDTPDTAGTEVDFGRPDLSFSYVREIPDALLSVTARLVQDDVDALDDDLALVGADGTQTDFGVTLRYEGLRTAPASIFLETSFDRTEYEDTTDPSLIDSDTYGLTLGTVLRFTDVLSATLSVGREREVDAAGAITETTTTTAELAQVLANGSIFGSVTHTDDGTERVVALEFGRTLALANGGSLTGIIGVTDSDLGGNDLTASVSLTNPLPDGAITASLSRSASYDTTAAETTVDTELALGWTRAVNDRGSIAVDFSWAVADAPSERIEETELAATYSYALSPASTLDVGVSYRTRDDLGGSANSPAVFVGLGRSF